MFLPCHLDVHVLVVVAVQGRHGFGGPNPEVHCIRSLFWFILVIIPPAGAEISGWCWAQSDSGPGDLYRDMVEREERREFARAEVVVLGLGVEDFSAFEGSEFFGCYTGEEEGKGLRFIMRFGEN